MIDVTTNKQESISDMLQQENTINTKDLNNLCYIIQELFDASWFIQDELFKEAEQTSDMHLKIISEGFDNILQKCHQQYLKLEKNNNWKNIGENIQ